VSPPRAELGRATVYGYFESLDALVEAMAEEAVTMLSDRVADAQGLTEALDVPLRFSQQRRAAFTLLFQQDARPAFSTEGLAQARAEARQILAALHRFSTRTSLPGNAAEAQAFLVAIAMAGVAVPELRTSTPLRRRWQDFCLAEGIRQSAGDDAPASAPKPSTK
jgi:AcrR family transcriptional regulator